MTTPSTTVLVDGTPDGVPTSEATSIYDDDSPIEEHATQRHHLEQSAVQTRQDGHRYPSAASFNENIDQLASNEPRDGVHPPTDQRQGERQHHQNTLSRTDGDHAPPTQHDEEPGDLLLRPVGPTVPVSAQGSQTTTRPSSVSPNQSHDETEINPSTEQCTDPGTPPVLSIVNQPPSSSIDRQRAQAHIPRRRRRLLRWLQRRLDHPLPWNLSLRRRAENIRQHLMNVDRVLP